MTDSRLTARVGNNSQAIQFSGDIVLGVSEERVRAIMKEDGKRVIAEFASEAQEEIMHRLEELDSRVIERLKAIEGLSAFKDPAFQRSYRKAQNGAAASERSLDYDMLAELLVERVGSGADRQRTLGLERAIEAMDQVDEEALAGLTAFVVISEWGSSDGEISRGLESLDELYAAVVPDPLPTGTAWLDHLDILDLIRSTSISTLKPFDQYLFESYPGWGAVGVLETGMPPTVGGRLSQTPWAEFVTLHELKPGYVRVAASSEAALRKMLGAQGNSQEVLDAFVAGAKEHLRFGEVDESLRTPLGQMARSFPTLRRVAAWWEEIPHAIQVTAVGRALARANILRLDTTSLLPHPDSVQKR